MKKSITIFFTGGTISMKIDPHVRAVIPALSPEDIMAGVMGIEEFAQIKLVHFSDLAGPQMTLEVVQRLSQSITEELNQDSVHGVIVTHGTDTLEETAYFLELTTSTPKPICVVGAMRNSSELGYDGPANLSSAVIAAISDSSWNRGVLVVMNNEINSASEVVKMNTLALDTFKSPAFGPLGIVDDNKAIYYRMGNPKQYIGLADTHAKVELIKVSLDMDRSLIDYCVDLLKVDGLIIEAMGRGNVPPSIADAIARAIQQGIPVVICSRCVTGRVLDTYGYEGAGRRLRESGAILGGDLPGHKARIKLILALGKTRDMQAIQRLFEQGLYD